MEDTFEKVFESYSRCHAQKDFFDDFYKLFMENAPEVRELFKNTDFKKQNTLLRVGLTYLISYAKGDPSVKAKIEELGALHGRAKLNIRPEWYPLWVNSLMKAAAKHDLYFNRELEQSWRKALQKGIDLMVSKY